MTRNFLSICLLLASWHSLPTLAASPQVTSGDGGKALITADGSLWMWGDSYFEGSVIPQAPCNLNFSGCTYTSPVKVGDGYSSVSIGSSHTLAIKTDGSLWSWGSNTLGQLGDGTTQTRWQPVQIGSGFVSVFASVATLSFGPGFDGGHSLGIKNDGSVWAWGANNQGQVGDGTLTSRSKPVQVASGNFIAVAATADSSAALKSDGSIWVWGGHNTINGTAVGAPLQPVQLATGFTALTAARDYFIALKADGSVWTWGLDQFAQSQPVCAAVIVATIGNLYCPQPRQFATGFTRIAPNSGLKADGSLWLWNIYGDSTSGAIFFGIDTPQAVGNDFIQLAEGIGSKSDGSVWIWGKEFHGALGYLWKFQALPAVDNKGQALAGSTFNLNTNTQSYPLQSSLGITITSMVPLFDPVILTATFQAAPADVGKPGQLFVVAHAGNSWLQLSKSAGWQTVSTLNAIAPYDSVTLGSHSVPLTGKLMFNTLSGIEVYFGYGSDASEMIANGTFKKVKF